MSDVFGDLFPASKPKPILTAMVSGEKWVSAKYGESVRVSGQYILLADDLLKRLYSWYGSDNLFASPRFLLLVSQFREISATMAGNKASDKKTTTKAKWVGFLDYRLSDEQLQELDEWSPNAIEVFEAVDGILLAGFRLTLSYNQNTKLATCTIIDDDAKRKSGGYGLSTADANCAAALKAAVYKHSLVLQGNWDELLDKPSQGGRRG